MSTYHIPERSTLRRLLTDYLIRIRRLEAIPPPPAVFEIKLFADAIWPDAVSLVQVGDGRFILNIDDKLAGWYLWEVQIYLTTVGSGDTTVQVRNITQSHDMLVAPGITIPAGERNSCGEDYTINIANSQVAACDDIALDVDEDGGGDAKGLGVILTLRDRPVAAT